MTLYQVRAGPGGVNPHIPCTNTSPCITIHQTYILHDPCRRHPSLDSKIVGCHPLCLLPIFFNKQDISSIKISQSVTSKHNLHSKINYEAFSRSMRVHIVKNDTIPSSKAPKPHVKLITYMNNKNGFGLSIAFIFAIIPQLGGLRPKYQDLVISFCLCEGKNIPQFRLRALHIKSGISCSHMKKDK